MSISAAALAAAERLRKQTGESRSAVFERALQGLVAAEHQAEQRQRYVDGYRRLPESRGEVEAALASALTALGARHWDEAG